MNDEQVEALAVKHESFGFGQVDAKGLTTHGFDPDGLSAFVTELLASRDVEITELNKTILTMRDAAWDLSKEREQLRQQLADSQKQVTLLWDEVTRCRDWFETQAKVTSKGGPSSWELMLLRDERDAAEEALAATEYEKPIGDNFDLWNAK